MGQTLSEPITEKETTKGSDDRLFYSASSMQGWRITMEDAHTTILDLLSETGLPNEGKKKFSFFAVYDGHGGATVAKYSGKHLHFNIAKDPDFKEGNYKAAIKNGFLKTDDILKNEPEYQSDPSGCTAVTVLITDDKKLFCGNAGDSRAVLSRSGKAVPLSHDHKPVNQGEQERIRAAGGYVEFGRVNGNLALSRAIGDFEFKTNRDLPPERQIVTVDPEILEETLGEDDEFIVLACDGIWDCKSNDQVVDYVRKQIAEDKALDEIAQNIMDSCVAKDSELGGVGCDNMTVVIVALLFGKSLEEWTKKVKDLYRASAHDDEIDIDAQDAEEESGALVLGSSAEESASSSEAVSEAERADSVSS
ncbi:Protein phosphatase 2C 2 [Phlyctochytrium planicorne]|nr:Protein phosphatase 2C 2 [Phlyctochytrium planicorne]